MAPAWELRDVPGALAEQWVADGHWNDDPLGQVLDRGYRAHAAEPFRIHSDVRPWTGTIGDVLADARRVAAGLRDRGVEPGDPVAFQLPNWREAAITFWAAALAGAVVVPIVHFYGPKEVAYILRRTNVRAFVTADRFGWLDYLANLAAVRADLPGLDLVAVVGESADGGELPDGTVAFDDLARAGDAAGPLEVPERVDPGSPALVAYTSGTTSNPKGVVHTHRTLGAEIRQFVGTTPPDAPPNLVGAPVGHAIGMLSALLWPAERGDPINLIDVWNPEKVLAAMVAHDLSSGSGATYFLTSLLDHPSYGEEHRRLMPVVGMGGSPVPAAVGERAESLGITLFRAYGSTEHPSITSSRWDDPREKRLYTDGRPMPGVEVRLVDDAGANVEAATPGEILSRGPDACLGYTDPELTRAVFDADGWYRTGDIAVQDGDGFLTIVDRKADVIIRGGENISALEVEEVLLRMPGVAEVAVVAVPDERMGERACAVIRILPDATPPGLDDVRAAMRASGLARQKWPEQVEVVDDLPRTPSGKVKKYVLRDQLRSRG